MEKKRNGFQRLTARSTRINGDYYSVSPYAIKDRMRVYWENKREHSVLKTENTGDLLLCEVGATMVGRPLLKWVSGWQQFINPNSTIAVDLVNYDTEITLRF